MWLKRCPSSLIRPVPLPVIAFGGVSRKPLKFRDIVVQEPKKPGSKSPISLFFSLLAGVWEQRPVRDGLRRQPRIPGIPDFWPWSRRRRQFRGVRGRSGALQTAHAAFQGAFEVILPPGLGSRFSNVRDSASRGRPERFDSSPDRFAVGRSGLGRRRRRRSARCAADEMAAGAFAANLRFGCGRSVKPEHPFLRGPGVRRGG
jgi:hypothetical protein